MIKLYFSGFLSDDRSAASGAFIVKDGDEVIHSASISFPLKDIDSQRDASFEALIAGVKWLHENGHSVSKVRMLSDDKKVISPMRNHIMRGDDLFKCERTDRLLSVLRHFSEVHFKFIKPYNNRNASSLAKDMQ